MLIKGRKKLCLPIKQVVIIGKKLNSFYWKYSKTWYYEVTFWDEDKVAL